MHNQTSTHVIPSSSWIQSEMKTFVFCLCLLSGVLSVYGMSDDEMELYRYACI